MRIFCLDFDGVCSKYDAPFDENNIPDLPVEGLFDFMDELSDFFRVVIYSSRSKRPEGIKLMKEWFEHHLENQLHGLPDWYYRLEFASEKPPAFLTLDDRALTFTGSWPSVQELRKFVPWNKQGKS